MRCNRRSASILSAILACAITGCASGESSERRAALEAGLRKGYPGVAASIRAGGVAAESAAAGFADIEDGEPMRVTTCFHIGSITKPITAVAALMLIDEGVLSLDAKLIDVLGAELVGRIPFAEKIAIRHLLDHSSGVYATNNDAAYLNSILGSQADPSGNWRPEQFLARAYSGVNEPFAPPGEGHFYSDTNYVLLGLIVEKASGTPFKDFVRERIFEPLKMADTFFVSDHLTPGDPLLERCAQGYLHYSKDLSETFAVSPIFKPVPGRSKDGVPLLNTTRAAERIDAAGGIMSTLSDLLKFGEALFKGGMLSEQSAQFLMAAGDGLTVAPIGETRTRAMQAARKRFGEVLYKEGDGPGGTTAVLAFHPRSSAVFAAFTNSFGHFDEADFLLDELFPAWLELER